MYISTSKHQDKIKITHPYGEGGQVPLDALRAEQVVVDLDGRRLRHVLNQLHSLGVVGLNI